MHRHLQNSLKWEWHYQGEMTIVANTDTRDWSFAKKALAELKSQPKKKKKHHRRREYYWVHVQLTNGRVANYQLPKDLQGPLDQHRESNPGTWKEVLLGALINVPTTKYQNGQAKIRPAVVQEILILPVGAHDSRWITRSQFVKPNYSWRDWFFNRVSMEREDNFLTHDFDQSNQQRIKTIVSQYRQQRVHQVRQAFWHKMMLVLAVVIVGGLLLWI